jgi:hypothetical protein
MNLLLPGLKIETWVDVLPEGHKIKEGQQIFNIQ